MSYKNVKLPATKIRVIAKMCDGGTIVDSIQLRPAHDQIERNRQIAAALHVMQDSYPHALHVTAEGGR
jgi:hypothetical protein